MWFDENRRKSANDNTTKAEFYVLCDFYVTLHNGDPSFTGVKKHDPWAQVSAQFPCWCFQLCFHPCFVIILMVDSLYTTIQLLGN